MCASFDNITLMTIQQYIDSVNQRFKQGNATEHRFQGDLQQLPASLSETARNIKEMDKVDFN